MSSSASSRKKTATEIYQKLSQLEHVLKRPDTYIGSVEFHELNMWICNLEDQMEWKTVKIVPGLYKIFDEILVNAADNKVNDNAMKNIKVDINAEEQSISVYNDGKGIPIEMHEKENIYVPELIFGNLLTSSNYDDKEEKVTGGRNGFGAKLCNIFSTKFLLETANNKQVYKQMWTDNMNKVHPPEIVANSTKKSYTKITFFPDLARFGMETFDNDFLGVLRRRVYDMAGTVKGITVTLNDTPIPIKNFRSYVDMFVNALSKNENASGKIIYANPNDRWEVAFALSDGNGFQQMSFVNSIATTSGGTHVDHVADQIIKFVSDQTNKGSKVGKLQRAQVKNHMFVFVNCKVNNPSFSSQTKEQLTSKVSSFGTKCELSDKFLKDCYKSTGLDDRLLAISENNANKKLKEADGGKRRRLTEYVKLTDASKAGSREGHKCTLIITEGDSAAQMAREGLKEVGYEFFGVFPIRGKILNVRDASQDQVLKNAEIKALKQIIGLQHKKHYDSTQGLRYGHVMMMTDQDHDGSHIKGLLINFFESTFPGLLNVPGFLREFITPIVKVTVESGPRKNEQISFYSMPEYEQWRLTEGVQIPKWRIKYYKGLGTSEPREMKGYFADIDIHRKSFKELQDGDDKTIDLVFSKHRTDDRKEWLQGFQPGTYLDHSADIIPISDFINKELILFSMADNMRSIPSVVDGLKPGQRKILWVCLNRVRTEMKVHSLGGMVTNVASYHHGEAALNQTIIGLAQNFVGTNNIYYLLPIGGFGSRDQGGKDASAPRYISTMPSGISRTVFPSQDDNVLTYVQEDEATVEPEYYVPIIPSLLVNGAEGIGTGWSTNIPSYNPTDIVENLKRMLRNEALKPMAPWYRGWTGQIEKVPNTDHQWRVSGKIEEIDETTLAITELPVKVWTLNMKEFLLKSEKGAYRNSPDKDKEKNAANEFIDDMWEEHGDFIRFIVKLSPEEMEKAKEVGLYKKFRLINNINTSNMVAFDPQGRLRKYSSAEEILQEFYHVRLDYYNKRREFLLQQLKDELERVSQRARFIKMIVEDELVVSKKNRRVLEKELIELKFPKFIGVGGKPYWPEDLSEGNTESNRDIKTENEEDPADNDNDSIDEQAENSGVRVKKVPTFDYLLNMHIASLTIERYERLLRERGETEEKLNVLLATDIKDMWDTELDQFLAKWEEFLAQDNEFRLTGVSNTSRRGRGGAKGGRGAARKRRGDDDDEDEYGSKPAKKRKTAKQVDYTNASLVPLPPIEETIKPEKKPRVKREPKEPKETTETKEPKEPKETKPRVKKEPTTAAKPRSRASPAAKDSKQTTLDFKPKPAAKKTAISDDEDSSMEVDPPVVRSPKPKRTRRAAASKIVIDSDSGSQSEGEKEDDVFQLSE